MIPIVRYGTAEADAWLTKLDDRGQLMDSEILHVVDEILEAVRSRGDKAVLEVIRKFDAPSMTLDQLRVTQKEIKNAYDHVTQPFLQAVRHARDNIERFHREQLRPSWMRPHEDGVILGELIQPLQRVGAHAPALSQMLVSSLIMNVVPAKVAGVPEVAVCIPPRRDGHIHPHMLVAAAECGIHEIYRVGGVPAIGAMAYGTETIRRVDKVVGPGNPYVQLAKKQVYGVVDIDKLAGPSEILVIADEHANPGFVASDLLSQAEHGTISAAVLVTPSERMAESVIEEIAAQVSTLSRQKELQSSLGSYSVAFLVADLPQAMDVANRIAPEHVSLEVQEPFQWLASIRNAGAILLGPYSPEAVGDYIAGPNHVLPTGGAARFGSPLSVDDFMKKTSIIAYTKRGLNKVSQDVVELAITEGLDGHAAAVKTRSDTGMASAECS